MSEDCHTSIGDPGYPNPPEGLAGEVTGAAEYQREIDWELSGLTSGFCFKDGDSPKK